MLTPLPKYPILAIVLMAHYPLKPAAVNFLGAGNDLDSGVSVKNVVREYTRLIDHARSKLPDAMILVNKVPYRRQDKELHRKIDELNDALSRECSKRSGCKLIDTRPKFPEQHTYARGQFVHFKEDGKVAMAKAMAAEIKKCFQPGRLITKM